MLLYYYALILRLFLCIPASATDATALNPKGIKTFLANALITFYEWQSCF